MKEVGMYCVLNAYENRDSRKGMSENRIVACNFKNPRDSNC
jgi:hypothetical protein